MLRINYLVLFTFLQMFTISVKADEWIDYVEKFKSAFTKCGDSYFLYIDRYGIPTQSAYSASIQGNEFKIDNTQDAKWAKFLKAKNDREKIQNEINWRTYLNQSLTELKGVLFSVKPKLHKTKATMADVLNGKAEHENQVFQDWDVYLSVKYKAIRSRGFNGWNEWNADTDAKYNSLTFFIQKNDDTYQYQHELPQIGYGSSIKIDKTTDFISPSCNETPKMGNN